MHIALTTLTELTAYGQVLAEPAAALPDGASVKDWVLTIMGNIALVILVVRCVGSWAKKEWGEFAGTLVAAVLVFGLVYANDNTVAVLKQIWSLFLGGA